MSLTTVAAPLKPDTTLLDLPPSRPEHFQLSDFIAAGLVFLITLGVYVATLAPSVTLEDSGELITAATKFGVGHPPGYPLWTMSGFLFSHLFPFGNLAWRINLLSALFGAASNGVLTLLVCHSGRWLLQRWTPPAAQPVARQFCFYAGLLSGLTIGFSDVMWSQAVISAVHGTIQALILNLVLLLFYLWMLEPEKTRRFVWTVFVFALGLTNHHTLVQVIPAFLLAAALIEFTPVFLGKPSPNRSGLFFSVFLAVNLFSLSILVYISWLAGFDLQAEQLQTISQVMATMIFVMTAIVSFFYMKEFRLQLFLLGVFTAVAIFAYGYYLMGPSESDTLRYLPGDGPFWRWGSFQHAGWLQNLVANARAGQPPAERHINNAYGIMMLALAALALGLLYTSTLNRRLIIGVCVVGWLGLMPYSYERVASLTHPPMNWGYAADRNGFYYEVTREQYPKSLPILIKSTFGKLIGVVDKNEQLDATIGLPDYFPRLGKTFYFYGDNLQRNFTVPLIFLTLAVFIYFRRCDWPQVIWYIFLGAAFFFLGFMLQLIAPQEAFDYQHNLQYKVFHLQSHCIFVLLVGYGALAAMTYLHESMEELADKIGVVGFGIPAVFLSLLPFWSNFASCNQADHWFGYEFGADIMRDMDKNAVYYGGSDPGRFVPTYMAFVESQQDPRWKREPGFDRRDVTVITQNALCDSQYSQYIRTQYDPRFRPKPEDYTPFEKWLGRAQAYPVIPVTCVSNDELIACWDEYKQWPEVKARISAYGENAVIRPGTNDVFDINGIVAQKIFEKNKQEHTFYVEQSVPIPWMYPYLEPWGLILKLSPDPLTAIPPAMVQADYKYWDDYSQKLLQDPKFHLDDNAKLTFGKLALWHADLYRWRHLDKEEEHWLRLAISLCPQLPDAVENLTRLLVRQERFDEAIAVAQQAALDDPFSELFASEVDSLNAVKVYAGLEKEVRAKLDQSPYDLKLNLDLNRLLQDEGKFDELDERMRLLAGLTNWTHDAMSDLIDYYVNKAHNIDAAIAFLEARAKIDPKSDEMIYNLAAFHATLNHREAAIKYLSQAANLSTNALVAAGVDPRFDTMRGDAGFQSLLNTLNAKTPPAAVPATNQLTTNPPSASPPRRER